MGWVWRDDSSAPSAIGNDFTDLPVGDSAADDGNCSTSKVVRSQCKTEEVEPGKFVKKCDKTEEILRHCIGKPLQVVHSTTEHTEEDVTEQMVMTRKSDRPNQFFEEDDPFKFPGLRGDVDAIERHFLSGMKSFFEAAEDMRSSLFDVFGDHHHHGSARRGIPIDDFPKVEEDAPKQPYSSGEIDLSGLAKDV